MYSFKCIIFPTISSLACCLTHSQRGVQLLVFPSQSKLAAHGYGGKNWQEPGKATPDRWKHKQALWSHLLHLEILLRQTAWRKIKVRGGWEEWRLVLVLEIQTTAFSGSVTRLPWYSVGKMPPLGRQGCRTYAHTDTCECKECWCLGGDELCVPPCASGQLRHCWNNKKGPVLTTLRKIPE